MALALIGPFDITARQSIGSLSNNDGDGHEDVT